MIKHYYGLKYKFVGDRVNNSNVNEPKILDLGCRDNILKKYFSKKIKYYGADLFQNENNSVDYVTNVEEGLYFTSDQYDFIIALDLLEHIERFQPLIMDSLSKLTINGELIIQLPNMSFLPYRIDFLFNGRFTTTNKYKLHYNYGPDRHRWLTTAIEIKNYFYELAKEMDLELDLYAVINKGKPKIISKILESFFISDNLYTPAYIIILKHNNREKKF